MENNKNKYSVTITYSNELCIKFNPYKGLRANYERLKKLFENDIVVTNKGELLEVLAFNGNVLRVSNGIKSYNIHIDDISEVYTGSYREW